MLSRKEQEIKNESSLSATTQKKIKETFNLSYETHLNVEKKQIDFFSFIYPSEIVLIFSLVSKDDDYALPVTLFLSADCIENQSDITINESDDLMVTLIDQAGHFFDEYFNSSISDKDDCYTENWQEINHKKVKLFYKISRENIKLFLLAEELLRN